MSNMAFGISQDDVENVLYSYGVSPSNLDMDAVMSIIDDDMVADMALRADFNMDDSDDEILNKQTELAYGEIAKQLFTAGFIKKENVEKFGDKNII